MIAISFNCDGLRCSRSEENILPYEAVEAFMRSLRSRGWFICSWTVLCPGCLEARELLGKLEGVK